MQKIVIIGGGICGLMSAYYLSKKRNDITIIDSTDLESTCSTGNAGLIVPSHFIPLASPGVIKQGLKWMFNPESPFGFNPVFSKKMFSWMWKFYRKSNDRHVNYSSLPLLKLNQFSRELYVDLYKDDNFDFELKQDGVLMLCKTEETANEEINLAEKAIRLGLNVQVLNQNEIEKLEGTKTNIHAGILYKSDAHLSPDKLIRQLIQYLKRQNVKFETNTEVTRFENSGKKIRKVICNERVFEADEVILAAGAFSSKLTDKLKLNIPVQAGKGYSITYNKPEIKIKVPALLMEARVAITPMGTDLRVAGTMEIGSTDNLVNVNRVTGILKSVPDYFPELNLKMPEKDKIWSGLRPCSPDGLPYIGRSKNYENLIITTGHSMMGLSLGPATGKIAEEIIEHKTHSVNILPFNPERYN